MNENWAKIKAGMKGGPYFANPLLLGQRKFVDVPERLKFSGGRPSMKKGK